MKCNRPKYFYYLIEQEDENGKRLASVVRWSQYNNLIYLPQKFKGIDSITPYGNKQAAVNQAETLNRCYFLQGNYQLSNIALYPVTVYTGL